MQRCTVSGRAAHAMVMMVTPQCDVLLVCAVELLRLEVFWIARLHKTIWTRWSTYNTIHTRCLNTLSSFAEAESGSSVIAGHRQSHWPCVIPALGHCGCWL